MEIIRVIVESVDAPENKYNYWLDLKTNTLKRWESDKWVPISFSSPIDPDKMYDVRLVEDTTPTKSVSVDNIPIVKLKGAPTGALANVEPDGSIDVLVKNDVLDVHIVDGKSEGPQKVEVTNNYLQTEIHNSEDNPIIVKLDNTDTNEVKVINSDTEAIPITNKEDAIYNPLYVTSTGNKPVIATLNPQTVNSIQIQGSGEKKNRAEVTDNKAVLVELPEGVNPVVYARPYGSTDFSVKLANVGTTASPTQQASLNVDVTNTHVPVKFDDSNLLKEIKETIKETKDILNEPLDVNLQSDVKISNETPLDVNIASAGNVPVTIEDELRVQVSRDITQIDASVVPVLMLKGNDPLKTVDIPVWVLRFLQSGTTEDFEQFFTFVYGPIASSISNSDNESVTIRFHIPCYQGVFNRELITFSIPCIVSLSNVHFKKPSDTRSGLFERYAEGTLVAELENAGSSTSLVSVGVSRIYPFQIKS